jgi:hypothetical protein
MAAEIINLKTRRKKKERDDKELNAQVNRAAFGRTKSEKKLTKAQRALEQKALDKHKRDD